MISPNTPKREEAQKIANDVVQFLANGGEIQRVPFGVLAQPEVRYTRSQASTMHYVRAGKYDE